MTDDEKREAERRLDYAAVKDLWQRGGGESGTRLENYTQGYAAGRESLKATMPEWEVRARLEKLEGKYAEGRAMWERTIDAERARSAKILRGLDLATKLLEFPDESREPYWDERRQECYRILHEASRD